MGLSVTAENEHLLRAEEARTGVPAEELLSQAILAHFRENSLPPDTPELERIARQEPAKHLCDAYLSLAAKQREETLSDAERDELTRLLEHLDSHHVRRMEAAASLAQRLGIALPASMERYGIRPLGSAG